MASGGSLFLCWTLLSVCQMVSSSAEPRIITAESGQTVSLPCKALKNGPVTVVDWSRTDVQPEKCLFLYRGDRLCTDNQYPSYKDRVDLQDRQMKDGDVSLILNNVTTDDSGTYTCHVQTKTKRRKRDADPITTIKLHIDPGHTSGHKEDGGDKEGLSRGHPGLIVGGVVVSLVVAVFLITVRNRKKKSSPPSSSSSPPLQSSDQLLA
ncbi:coxsackievirus and adenovirus receptor-like [Mugil cephalus]|uniref:coxsackievirus and adenovirus receptor-like n=1 Tax=Mugil cephalus TaxID=48193 RepID=UPI001FB67E57|nr:coxsackievirus and adenovirus receptor-like [Mugil cephalus]